MNDILKLAEQLGQSIAASPPALALKQARQAVQADTEATKMLQDFHAQAEKIARAEHEHKPVEVADKHRLQDMQDKLAGNEKVKKLTEAQMEYIDLLRHVNQTLRGKLAGVEGGQEGQA